MRTGYPPEFRQRVVGLVEGGPKVADVACDLGISDQPIYTWRRQARIDARLEAGRFRLLRGRWLAYLADA